MRITMAALFADDQDSAAAFYTEKLGFEMRTDVSYGPGARWLTVASPEDPKGTELLLTKAEGPALEFQRNQRSVGKPAIAFKTDDIEAECARLRAEGVVFTLEPTRMEYGGTDAVLDDTCGNLVCIHQD